MYIQLTIEPAVCVRCGVCVDSCPTDVIASAQRESVPHVAHGEDCQGCFLCVFDCPVDAISLKQARVAVEEIGVAWHNVKVNASTAASRP